MADNKEPKSMNTHLHVLEAWSSLYKVWKDPLVEKRLTEMLNLFPDRIIRRFNKERLENRSMEMSLP